MAGYEARQSYRLRSSRLVFAVFILSLALTGWAKCVFAQDQMVPLHLDVVLNGQPTNLIAGFSLLPNGRLAATPAELQELRIDAGTPDGSDDLVALDAIENLTYQYNEELQQIAIFVAADVLEHTTYVAHDGERPTERASTTTGAVINYGLYGSINEDGANVQDFYNGITANLDGRLFGDYGTLESSSILGFEEFDTLRVDTTWSRSFPDTMISVRVGDFISGGLSWTRPIRMAGLQVQRDFALRPDLITKPLPTVSGSAAVPSTVDVYVNKVKTYTKNVPSGPFTISQLPVISGGGVTSVVVRDATGRETVSETPFYSASELLREGMWDYSAEIGLARLNYGSISNDYETSPIASGSFRYGLSDTLTLAGHGEGGLGVVNGSGGFLSQIGMFGTVEMGASVSAYDGDVGGQLYAAFQGEYKRMFLNVRSQRTFGDYTDVAAKAIDIEPQFFAASNAINIAPAKAIDFISLGVPVDFTGGNLNVSYLHNENASGDTYDIGSLSYSQRLTENISMYSTGFKDFSEDGNMGLYVGMSMSLGDRQSLSAGATSDSDGTGFTGTYSKTADRKPGSVGWRVRASEGKHKYQQADMEYHASAALLRGSVSHSDSGLSGSAYVDGAVAMTADGVFFSKRIDDSFAIVDAGAPNVEVRHENQVIGVTDSDGKLLVTGLHAYQKNKITIDPNSLPVNAYIPQTSVDAVPANRSGMSVRFDVDDAPRVAVVEFLNPDGTFVEAGYAGTLASTGEEFIVGYDGRAFIQGLSAVNTIEIEMGENSCRATFPFAEDHQTQVMISQVICQ